MEYNEKYMRRALQLAARGAGFVSPNPMVGAVIVSGDRIIGEGYHRRFGQAHAEVNAVNSVSPADRHLLSDSTIYVTLEPCSHYGKTPPCAKLLIDCGIPRVVIGAVDPFSRVAGRGIDMLREAGIDVVTGILADESRRLNASFFTAHTLHTPFVTLKWAQSSDGYMDRKRLPGQAAARFSNDVTTTINHRLRSLNDAILTSAVTANADRSRLTVRDWPGLSPRPVVIDRNNRLAADAPVRENDPIIYTEGSLPEILSDLYSTHGVTSLLVEAGPTLLQAFIDSDLWDVARVETAPILLGDQGTASSPRLAAIPLATEIISGNRLDLYSQNPLIGI